MADEELFQLLQTGNEEAFKVLFERYQLRLFMEADNKLNNVADAHDIVQEVFISLWQKRTTINIQVSLKHYLLQIARYKCIDVIRIRTTAEKHQQQYAYFKELAVVNNSIENLELGRHLHAAIDSIPAASQTAFKMMYQDQKSLKEIANEMGLSKFTVKNHIGNALKNLRKRLKKVK